MSTEPRSPYEALGGDPGVTRLVERFYGYMDALPEAASIRAMHAEDLEPMIEKLSVFLIGWMGGPRTYSERFGSVVIPAAHTPFAIGPDERDQWLLCMEKALQEEGMGDPFLAPVTAGLRQMAEMCRTDQ